MDLNFLLQPIFWTKAITLILIGAYIIFSFVILNQVKTMIKILHLPHFSTILKTIAVAHLLLAISLFLLAIVIL